MYCEAVQAFFKDQLTGCRNNGMQLPQGIDPRNGLPLELVVYADPRSECVGETVSRAYKAGGNYFNSRPLIIFVILPERGKASTWLCALYALCSGDIIDITSRQHEAGTFASPAQGHKLQQRCMFTAPNCTCTPGDTPSEGAYQSDYRRTEEARPHDSCRYK